MPTLLQSKVALAAPDSSRGTREDGSDNWSVHHFDRMGRWRASVVGLTKGEALREAALARRRLRSRAEGGS